ncbi:MAG: PD40 domain-containing protein [Acidobacteria bacterium]|nr:PD40 domain-containing protein [Acidobacteriota bacterium]
MKSCLAKNPEDRFQAAHDVRLQLKWITEELPQLTQPSSAAKARPVLRWLPWGITAMLVALTAAAFLLTRSEKPSPRYTTVTFREGTLLGARFSQDGQTIVYSGRWEGELTQVSVARVGSPESRLLGISGAEVASISSSNQLAILVGCEENFFLNCGGTLATVDLAGGSPRILAEHVAQADWHPDGKRLAITVTTTGGPRLEFPPGHVLYQQKAGWFGYPRFSPDGNFIAFENHPIKGNDDGQIDLIDLNGHRSVLFRSDSVEGLAWSRNGKEVWAAAAKAGGWADTLYALKPGGKPRTILTSPSIRLYDISKDGRVLLSHETWRRQMKGLFPGDKSEHPYSWLDDTQPTGFSADGRYISFYEGGDVYALENDFQAYYRPTDGSPAIRLGVGTLAISPDGKWVATGSNHNDPRRPLQLQPLGPGEARSLPTPGLVAFDRINWSDGGQRIVYEAQTEQGDWNVFTQQIANGSPLRIARARDSYPVISPDGKLVALHEPTRGISLYSADGGPVAVLKAAMDSELPMRFAKGGKSLLVGRPTGHELVLTLIDLSSGRREPWKRIPTEWRAEQLFEATPDWKYYAYPFPRYSSRLYIVDNLR